MGVAVTIEAKLGAPVADGGTVFFNYPRGSTQADFVEEKALAEGVAVIDGNDVYREASDEVALAYGAQLVSVTNLSGLTWPAGATIRASLAYRDLAVVVQAGGDGLTIEDVNEAIDERIGELGAPIDAATLTTLLNGAEGTDLVNLGSASARVVAAAGATEKAAVLASFESLEPQVKSAHMGAMLEEVNAGEFVVLDELRRTSGLFFTPPSIREMILGEPGVLPPDLEALRAPDDFQDATSDIAAGALTIDLAEGRAWKFDFSAALNLRFANLPAGLPPRFIVGVVQATNVHASTPQNLSFVSGGGFAGVALHWGLASPLEIANGATATLHFETDDAGALIVTHSDVNAPTPPASGTVPVVTNPGTISGTGKIGSVHTVTGAAATGSPTPALTFAWERDGTPIGGATASSYTPVAADDGADLTRVVTATNTEGSDSDETAILAITFEAPVALGELDPQTFSAGGGVETYDASGDFSVVGDATLAGVTWSVPGAPTGVTIDSDGIVQIDTDATGALVASTITVRATNSGGFDESTFALTIETVPEVTAAGTIAGGGKIGTLHTVTGTTVTGNPTPTLTYQWERGGTPIAGATAASYTPVAADDNTNLTRVVTATNSEGSDDGETAAQAITYNAPVAANGLVEQNFAEDSGVQTYDASTDFSVSGGSGITGITWSVPGAPTGVTINGSGVVQIDTGATGSLVDETITVRATNSGGFDESTFDLNVNAEAGVEFVDQSQTTAPGTSIVAPNGLLGDLLLAFGGNASGNVAVDFNTGVDLESDNNGSGVSCGSGYSANAPATGPTITAANSLHRMRCLRFRNAASVQSADPAFSGLGTNMVFPGFPGGTVPGGGGRVVLMGYCTSTNGGISSDPAGFTRLSGNGFTPAWISDDVLLTFNGATAVLANSVVKGMQTAVILQ